MGCNSVISVKLLYSSELKIFTKIDWTDNNKINQSKSNLTADISNITIREDTTLENGTNLQKHQKIKIPRAQTFGQCTSLQGSLEIQAYQEISQIVHRQAAEICTQVM